VEIGNSASILSWSSGPLVVQNNIQSLEYGKYISLANRLIHKSQIYTSIHIHVSQECLCHISMWQRRSSKDHRKECLHFIEAAVSLVSSQNPANGLYLQPKLSFLEDKCDLS
jgi:hypothetical protein